MRTPHAPTRPSAYEVDCSEPRRGRLAARLPLSLSFADAGGVEKVARLRGTPRGPGVRDSDEPGPGEIGAYDARSKNLVLYSDPGWWPGLVRLGRVHVDLDQLRNLPDGTVLRLASA